MSNFTLLPSLFDEIERQLNPKLAISLPMLRINAHH
jgi:hypothetical protein